MSLLRRTPPAEVSARERSKRPILVAGAVALVAIVVNIPLLAALLASFKTDAQIVGDPLGLPSPITLVHYSNVLYAAGYDFPLFFRNSALIASFTVVAVLMIGLPAAYAIVRLGLGGRWLLNAVAGLRLLPAIFFVLPLFVMFSNLGLLDTIAGMVVVSTFLNLPIAMVLLSRGIAEMPIELEEAANVDGAGPARTLYSVVLPIIAPTMVAAGVITFLFTWNDFLFAVVITTTNARTVTVGASNFITSFGILWGDVSAVVVLSVLIPVMFAVFAQRYLVSGLSAGAVKE
jgi:multiple sugar transport system permease protein